VFLHVLVVFIPLAFLSILVSGCGFLQTQEEKLIFISMQKEEMHLYVARSDDWILENVSDIAIRHPRPQWSPDGKRLAFAADYQGITSLYIVENSKQAERLTSGMEVSSYAWDPDGNAIAFSAVQAGEEDIYVISVDTPNSVNLTSSDKTADYIPTWSNDGTYIAFLSSPGVSNHRSCQEGCKYQVRLMHRNGSDVRQIKKDSSLGNSHVSECAPAWSPNDRYLAFTRGCYPSEPFSNIYVLDLQTGRIAQLTSDDTRDQGAVWLSNDELIFRSVSREGSYLERLYTMKRNGTNQRPFLPWDHVGTTNSIDWTKDRHWFVWQDKSTNEIMLGYLPTGEVEPTGVKGCAPQLSASSSWIAFTTECIEANTSDIWVMKRNGSPPVNLSNSITGRAQQPLWAP